MGTANQPQIKQLQESPRLQNGTQQNGSPSLERRLERPLSKAGLRVSEEKYWAIYYHDPDFSYEWNDGILEEKPMAKVNAAQYQWFCSVLDAYLTVNPVARMINLEIGFRLPLAKKTTIRRPDLFIVRNDNLNPLRDDDYTFAGICDLAIESISDSAKSEIERDTVHKKTEYAEFGVREYFIIDGEGRYTTFYRRAVNGGYEVIPIDENGVLRSAVLPGFQFRVRDLYHQPWLIDLADDPVYQHFVLPEYQAEKRRATEADMRAAKADARAERYAAQLRALGLSVE